MSYYFLILLLIVCIIADAIIIHKGLFDKYRSELQIGLIFSILSIPVGLLLYKLDDYFKPLQEVSFIIKGIIIGLLIVLIDTGIYLLIRRVNRKIS